MNGCLACGAELDFRDDDNDYARGDSYCADCQDARDEAQRKSDLSLRRRCRQERNAARSSTFTGDTNATGNAY